MALAAPIRRTGLARSLIAVPVAAWGVAVVAELSGRGLPPRPPARRRAVPVAGHAGLPGRVAAHGGSHDAAIGHPDAGRLRARLGPRRTAGGRTGRLPRRLPAGVDRLRCRGVRRRRGPPPAGCGGAVGGGPAVADRRRRAGAGGAGAVHRSQAPLPHPVPHPIGFLAQRYRPGMRAAFAIGRSHGLFCVGCCWALILLSFAVGLGSLVWMAELTALMVVERAVPGGDRVSRPQDSSLSPWAPWCLRIRPAWGRC